MQPKVVIEAKVADTGQIQLEWCLRALSIMSSIPPTFKRGSFCFNLDHFVNILNC